MRKSFIQNGFGINSILQTTPNNKKKSFVSRTQKNRGGSVHDQIASIESGGNYSAVNPNSSASGKYQFLWSLWGNKIKNFTGVKDRNDFLNNPTAQENFYKNYYVPQEMEPAVRRISNKTGVKDLDSLRKLYHYRGEKGAIDYLSGNLEDQPESYNMPISEYTGLKKMALGGIVSSGLTGLSAGSSIGGPVGAIGGGALGIISGVLQDAQNRKMLERQDRSNMSSFSNIMDVNSASAYKQAVLNQSSQYLAKGGKINNTYEAEKDEVIIGSDTNIEGKEVANGITKVGGKTHEEGGTPGSGGEFVFSNRLAVGETALGLLKQLGLTKRTKLTPESTFAEASEALGKVKNKFSRKESFDYKVNNTDKVMNARAEAGLSALAQIQESLKQ